MFSDDILSLADKNTKHEDEEEFGDRRFISSHSSLELFCADALLSKMVLIFSAANDLLVVHIFVYLIILHLNVTFYIIMVFYLKT